MDLHFEGVLVRSVNASHHGPKEILPPVAGLEAVDDLMRL
jgi:hypothetical protein